MEPNPAPPQPDIAAVLDAALPRLRMAQVWGWALLIASGAVGLYSVVALFDLPPGNKPYANVLGVVMGLAIVGVAFAPVIARRAHEAALMPALAGALGLTYQAQDRRMASTLPARLLPRQANWSTDSVISGRIADRPIRFAEVTIKTKGKNSRTLFDGLVLEFQNAAELPVLLIALRDETTAGFLQPARLDTAGLVLLTDQFSGGRSYGVWTTDPDRARRLPVAKVIDALVASESDLGGDGTLYSAMTDGRTTWLAFRKTRDIFRIGGLFATRDGLLTQMQAAAQDFALPLRLVARLLEIEARAARPDLPAPPA